MPRPTASQVVRPSRPASQAAVTEPLEKRQLLSGLNATYYDNADFTGTSISRIDSAVSFNWGSGSPDPSIGSDTFSARWTGSVRAKYTERYTFSVDAPGDKARVWVDGRLIVDTWDNAVPAGIIDLEVGRMYDIKVEYREDTGSAGIKLQWKSASQTQSTISTNSLYPPSAPTTATKTSQVNAVGTANVASYGAKGNGSADDAGALQKAIDALPAYGTLRLEPRTYKLNKGLVIDKPLTVEGNGALLLLNTSAYPYNTTIMVISRLNSKTTTWSENIAAGQSTFHPTFTPGTFTVGQWVAVELGQDPYDPNEEHFTAIAPVTAVGNNSITVGATTPYAINAGNRPNKITPLDSLATQVNIRNLKFDHIDGTVPDTAIFTVRARNVTVDGVSGRFNQVMIAMDTSNSVLKNVNASLVNGHSAAGRVFTAWGSLNMQVTNIQADTASDKAVFFVESWTRNTKFTNVDVHWHLAASPSSAVFHLTGGSSGTIADQVRIDNTGPVMLAGMGGQRADFEFGTVSIRGAAKSLPMTAITDLTVGTRHYGQAVRVTKTIDLSAGWNYKQIPLVAGAFRSFKATTSKVGAVTVLGLVNATGNGYSTKQISSGSMDWTESIAQWGSVNLFNDANDSMKSIWLSTPANLAAGTRLTIEYEYYPPGS